MENLQDLVSQWWMGADFTTQMAVVGFGAVLVIAMIFSIIGTYTNPNRRPDNEIDFRRFAEASLAAQSQSQRLTEIEPEEDTESLSERPFYRPRL